MARGSLSEADELAPLVFLLSPLPFVVADDLPFALDVEAGGWPSRTSSRTRLRRAGNVVTSPERRRAKAWFWMAVGQLEELELRAWRRASWILGG
jgi:hypothetical protein